MQELRIEDDAVRPFVLAYLRDPDPINYEEAIAVAKHLRAE